MERIITQSPILVNHIGFTIDACKRFILCVNSTGSDEFTVELMDDCKRYEVYKGKLEKTADGEFWTGDFSEVKKCGDYRVYAGGYKSRSFVIYDKAYDMLARMLFSYFTYQRCGSELGWAGKCHCEDGFIKETGEHADLAGGYHQSCDLRKSPGGVSIGVLGMMRYAIKDNSSWGRILVADEVKWACDYFVKTIQGNGVMYNTLNAPFGWDGRIFYKSGAPSSAQWCVTSILALGASYFKDTDRDCSEKYLETALRSWNYLVSDERSSQVYDHPEEPPRGMDKGNFYRFCKKGNVADMSYMAVAAADLYSVCGDEKYLEYVKLGADKLVKNIPDIKLAMCITEDDNGENLTFNGFSYSWLGGGYTALCVAAELLPDNGEYIRIISAVADGICKIADKSVWKSIKGVYSDKDLDIAVGHSAPGKMPPTLREQFKNIEKIGSISVAGKDIDCYINADGKKFAPATGLFNAVFLEKAYKITGNYEYSKVARIQLDKLLGANIFDSCHVTGIGFNHAGIPAFGQFFPSTPYIPGAVNIGFEELSVNTESEYDMPCVGMALYLLSEYLD